MENSVLAFIAVIFFNCTQHPKNNTTAEKNPTYTIINQNGQTIKSRIRPPENFIRIQTDENSFANHLRHLPLKPHGSKVRLYNGKTKWNFGVYDAVVDLNIGKKTYINVQMQL